MAGMKDSTYREYMEMFEDIKKEVSESGNSSAVVERAKVQVKRIFRDLYGTYGREDYYVKYLRDFMDWYL